MMSDEADAATEDKEAVKCADLDVFLGLFWCKRTAIAQEVNEADGNASINVQDELCTDPLAQNPTERTRNGHTVSFLEVVIFSTARA